MKAVCGPHLACGPWVWHLCSRLLVCALLVYFCGGLLKNRKWKEANNKWTCSNWMQSYLDSCWSLVITLNKWLRLCGRTLLAVADVSVIGLNEIFYCSICSMAGVPCIWLPTKATWRSFTSFSKLAVTWTSKTTWVHYSAVHPLMIPVYRAVVARVCENEIIP